MQGCRRRGGVAETVVDGVQLVMMLVGVVITVLISSAGTLETDPRKLDHHDVCRDEDAARLQCRSALVVHVHKVRCAESGQSLQDCVPAVSATVLSLCDGRRSCAGLGLRDVLPGHCSRPAGMVVVSFTCEQAPVPAPSCRSNLCSSRTLGLGCPQGSVLHVQNATCGSARATCSPATLLTLYSLCEGRLECDASGLRMLTPLSMYCDGGGGGGDGGGGSSLSGSGVFIDYVCVPDKLVHNQCNGQYRSLTEPFGVLTSPGFAGDTPSSAGMQCNWYLPLRTSSHVLHVLVHMAYSKWGDSNCSSHFLQIRYKDCVTGSYTTGQYCDLTHVNCPLVSCGPVTITSWLPATAHHTDRFLLSYHLMARGSTVATPGGMAECLTPLVSPVSTPVVTLPPTVFRRNYGPGRTMFDYSDTIRHTGEGSEINNHAINDSNLQFKLIILYVFFGVVILALIIALIYVLVSYRGISRRRGRGRHEGDSSEKTALWRHDDTPLDTFNHNSRASLIEVANCNIYTPPPEATTTSLHQHADGPASWPDPHVVSCTVHAESVTTEEDNRLSAGSALSSLLSGKDTMDLQDLIDSFNPYDTIDASMGQGPEGQKGSVGGEQRGGDEGGGLASTRSSSFMTPGEGGNIYEAIDPQSFNSQHHHHPSHIQEDIQDFPPPPPELLSPSPPALLPRNLVDQDPSPVEHYTINNDDYALVKKPKSKSVLHPVVSPVPAATYTNVNCLLDGEEDGDHDYDTVDDSELISVQYRPSSIHSTEMSLRNGHVSPS